MSAAASPPRGPGCLSDLALDRVVAGADPAAAQQAHLQSCGRCAGRLELLRAAQRDDAVLVRRLAVRAQDAAPARRRWPLALGLALPALAALVLVLVPALRPAPSPSERMKGTALRFFVQRDGQVRPGVSGDLFRAGDALRFVLTTDRPLQFLLVGVDADGSVRAYHPFDGARSVEVPAGADQALPGSLVLDAARGTEYFVGLLRDGPIALDEVRAALRRDPDPRRALETLPAAARHWIVVRKE